jgi:hypothetical protein
VTHPEKVTEVSHFLRRHFLTQNVFSLGGVALSWLLQQSSSAAPPKPVTERQTYDLEPRLPTAAPQARAMISMFMQGGPSHLDLFDPKPELTRHHMQTASLDFGAENSAQSSRKLFASPWRFRQHGQCGTPVSELLPHLAPPLWMTSA